MDADQEVSGNLALFAQHLDVGRDQSEAVFIQRPLEQRIGLQVLPGLVENRVQVQDKIFAVEAQFALAQVTTDQPADVTRRRCPVGGIETHLLQVGGEADFLIVGRIRPVVGQDVAQGAGDAQLVNHLGNGFWHRRQRIH